MREVNIELQMGMIRQLSRLASEHFGTKVLDFGCGDGSLTRYLHKPSFGALTVGYDPNEESIAFALRWKVIDGMVFSSSKDVLVSERYDSALSSFVMHEAGLGIFGDIYDTLYDGGKICVADYHLKGASKNKFSNVFTSMNEMAELKRQGLDGAWKKHTAMDLWDCVAGAEDVGFKTIKSEIVSDTYFLWVGQK